MFGVNIEKIFLKHFNYRGSAVQQKQQENESNYIFIDIFFCSNSTEIYIPFILPLSTLLGKIKSICHKI